MQRLNYFNPYLSKSEKHEDRLTRAFMIVLRHSPNCFYFFYNQIQTKLNQEYSIPSSTDIILEEAIFETQVGSTQFETSSLLSILITDSEITPDVKVEASERGAVYDGVIKLGNELGLIIETKPNHSNVWTNQLNPSEKHLTEDIVVIEQPIILTWSSIIEWMTQFSRADQFNYGERLIVDDFLDLVQAQFSSLNPFDRLDKCRGNRKLITKRAKNILQECLVEDSLVSVQLHHNWGHYIELDSSFKSIRKIGLIINKNNDLELSLYFGDTQGQSKELYPININPLEFNEQGWEVRPNFHFAFMTSNKIWFRSENTHHYIKYWNEHAKSLKQLPSHESIKAYLQNLVINKVVNDKPERMQSVIYESKMNKMNVCAGLGFIYVYPLDMAEQLDKKGELAIDISEKIRHCISEVLNRETVFLKTK